MGMTDAEIIDCLGIILVDHPAWAESLRVNIFTLGAQDAQDAVRETWGSDARITTFLMRRDAISTMSATGGSPGFWVSNKEAFEVFIKCESEEQAFLIFKKTTGKIPNACVGHHVVAGELARMNTVLDGRDLMPLASKAFLAMVAAP